MLLHRCVIRYLLTAACLNPMKGVPTKISPIWCWMMQDSLKKELGYSDQQKFGEYFESIRAIETQISRLEGMKQELSKVDLDIPMDGKMPRGEYIRLMGDLMVASLQTGLTNVATFMVGPERWDTPYLFESLFDKPKSHHQMSHNQGKFLDDLIKVDYFYMEQFAYLCNKMNLIEEANGKTSAWIISCLPMVRVGRWFDSSIQCITRDRCRFRRWEVYQWQASECLLEIRAC